MSEQDLKLNKKTKIVIFVPLILLITALLLLSSCGSTYATCAAYASVETKNELK